MLVSICWDTFEGTLSLEKKGINLMLNRHLANCLTNSIKEVQLLRLENLIEITVDKSLNFIRFGITLTNPDGI